MADLYRDRTPEECPNIPQDLLARRIARGLDPLTGRSLNPPDQRPKPIHVGVMKACCADLRNSTPWEQAPDQIRLYVRMCRRCLCRHFTIRVEPAAVGAVSTPLGSRPVGDEPGGIWGAIGEG